MALSGTSIPPTLVGVQYPRRVVSAGCEVGGRLLDLDVFAGVAIDSRTTAVTERIRALMAPFHELPVAAYDAAAMRREDGSHPAFQHIPSTGRGVTVKVPGRSGPIDLRVVEPLAGPRRGLYFWVHGGGWVTGDVVSADGAMEAVADRLGVVTVGVDYRLAPEHPHPAGVDDVEDALVWVVANGAQHWGADRIVVTGGSAGAHLAAAALVRLRDRDLLAGVVAAVLSIGIYDLRGLPSLRTAGMLCPILPQQLMEWFIDQYAPPQRRGDPDVSPLLADLSGLPPALFVVGTHDPLLDDSVLMARRWRAAGNEAELAVYPGGIHGFQFVKFDLPLKSAANARAEAFVAQRLQGVT